MNQILRCDWLPEQARWSYLARSGIPGASSKKNFPESHIINPLLTKLVRSRWLDIDLVFIFCEFMDLDSVSVHKHAKKELGQYPAILTLHLVNNPYLFSFSFLCGRRAGLLVRALQDTDRAVAGVIAMCSWARHFTLYC